MNKLFMGTAAAGLALCAFAADIPLKPADFNAVVNKAGVVADGDTITLTGKVMLRSANEIPYVEGKTYGLKCEIKNVEGTPDDYSYVGFIPYDANHKEIYHNHAVTVPNTETKLTADVKPDDTFIMVEDGSKWKSKGSFVVAFDAKADLSDLPNRSISSSVKTVEKTDNGWKVIFHSRVGKTAKAGVMVREHRNGGYVYVAQANNNRGIVNPTQKIKKFYPGTKYVKAIVLGNWSAKDPAAKLTVKNFCVTEE